MKQQIATTQDQSDRLLRCGVSADTADVSWHGNTLETFPQITYDMWLLTPAWSLSALLGLLPKEICDENDDSYYFSLAQEYPLNADYRAAYKYYSVDECDYVGRRSSQPIEACVQLIEWLKENNYKLNEI